MAEETITYAATGRRKTAVARVRLVEDPAVREVNGRAMDGHFPTVALQRFIGQPLALTQTGERFGFRAWIKGGGTSGQAGALRHALSRALVAADPAFKVPLKSSGCLTRDPRMKERKKPGRPGARKRFQFSKR